jgi:hypothetical protein
VATAAVSAKAGVEIKRRAITTGKAEMNFFMRFSNRVNRKLVMIVVP